MTPISTLVVMETAAQRILLIRERKVVIDADLADMYDMPTKTKAFTEHRSK